MREWRTLSFTQTPQGQQGRVHTRGVGHDTELSFKKTKQNKTISGYILQVATKARGAVKPRAQQPFVWGWKRTTLGW